MKQLVCKYVYDAWGNCKVLNPDGTINTDTTFIGNVNPFRYRSYYFDVETGFYYLQSRYYDPQVGRFISMDSVEYLAPDVVNGLNLYAYYDNCPTMGYDPTGESWDSFWGVVGNFFKETFGAYKRTSVNVINNVKDFLIASFEQGESIVSSTGKEKPVSVFFEKATENPWQFWRYQVGLSLNFGKFNMEFSLGIGSSDLSVGYDNYSFETFSDVEKIGVGWSHTQNNVKSYTNFSIKSRFVAAVIVAVACPISLPVTAPAVSANFASVIA